MKAIKELLVLALFFLGLLYSYAHAVTLISGGVKEFDYNELVEKASNQIKLEYGTSDSKLILELLNFPEEANKIVHAYSSFEVEILQKKLASRMAVKLMFRDSENLKKTLMFWFKVKNITPAFYARKTLNKNHVIEKGDFLPSEVDQLQVKNRLENGVVVGKILNEKVREKSILFEKNVSERPLVLEGEKVELIAVFKGITITDKATAVENSDLKGFVKVIIQRAEKSILAKYIRPGIVEYVNQ